MCGRFTNMYTWRELYELYSIHGSYRDVGGNYEARYNVAPMQRVFAARPGSGGRELFNAQWSLWPFWPKNGRSKLSTFNATIERLRETESEQGLKQGIFGRAWNSSQRCLIVASGWYEWPVPKQPRYFTLQDGEPFAFAGIWDRCRTPEGEMLESCTIVTVEPNEYVGTYHDRAPALLTPDDFEPWLSAPSPAAAATLCAPYRGEDLISWPVGPAVGNWRNEGPEPIEPATV
jgi:putative SOS response-associated peptidase YedK